MFLIRAIRDERRQRRSFKVFFLVPTLCVGMPSRTLCVLQERSRTLAGRGASRQAFPRRAWEREIIKHLF